MRRLSLILFFVYCYCFAFGQALINGHIKDIRTGNPIPNAKVELLKIFDSNDSIKQSVAFNDTTYVVELMTNSDSRGYFELSGIKAGSYALNYEKKLDSIGLRSDKISNILLSNADKKSFDLQLPYLCRFSKDMKVCPKCHKNDETVNIVYGYPEDDDIEKEKKGEIVLGGCIFDRYCKPRKYCKHDHQPY